MYKRQGEYRHDVALDGTAKRDFVVEEVLDAGWDGRQIDCCLLYTSDAADERSSVDLGGRRIIKKKNK